MIVYMLDIYIYISLILLGLCLGSFAGATVWRLRARQLSQDKKSGEHVDHNEYQHLKSLMGVKLKSDHSHCLHCGHQLKWYDLIPLVSWLSLKGRCRYCKKPIGLMEPLIEVGLAVFFVLLYSVWPGGVDDWQSITVFVLWLMAGVGLAILFAYDLKWFLLPDAVNFFVIAIGALVATSTIIFSDNLSLSLWNVFGSVAILGGIYLILYLVSKGRWIGFGDVKLGLGLGLLLGDWKLAALAVFLANLIGCLIVIPMMLTGKLKRNSHVPFGPLLITGTIIAQLFGAFMVETYMLSLM